MPLRKIGEQGVLEELEPIEGPICTPFEVSNPNMLTGKGWELRAGIQRYNTFGCAELIPGEKNNKTLILLEIHINRCVASEFIAEKDNGYMDLRLFTQHDQAIAKRKPTAYIWFNQVPKTFSFRTRVSR